MNRSLLSEDWYDLFVDGFFQTDDFQDLKEKLIAEYQKYKVCPPPDNVFDAFRLTPFNTVKVVLLGQDPYPFGNHAHGLAFSSKMNETPPSLRVILRELDRDVVKTETYEEFKKYFPNNDLTPWAKQGVFLLNTVLSVRAGISGSHFDLGWQKFTDHALTLLYKDRRPKVFVAWGAEAQSTIGRVITPFVSQGDMLPHIILKAGHPAAGRHAGGKDTFSGCSHFSKVNQYLLSFGQQPIEWRLRTEASPQIQIDEQQKERNHV